MEKGALRKQKRRKQFIYLTLLGIFFVVCAFLFYELLIGQAFADRGVSENVLPVMYSSQDANGKIALLSSVQERFKCSNNHKVDVSHFNSVGMFPYLLRNGPDICNRASDFVGYDQFIDAMLHGERNLGQPASTSKPSPFNHHHPGLEALREMYVKGEKIDRSVDFYWWIFPVPMGMPNRGFSYAIFQGDLEGLHQAAHRKGFQFVDLLTEGLKLFMALQGWDIELSKPASSSKSTHQFTYDDRDHIVTKAWISFKCFSEYLQDNQKISLYKKSLETFMKTRLIRYPADYKCNQ
jgi:hypothetical protein